MSYLIEKMSYYIELSAEEKTVLLDLESVTTQYKARTIIYHQEAQVGDIFVVREGWVATFSQLPNGNRTILNIHYPGDIVGSSSMPFEVHASGLMSITPVTLCPFPKEKLATVFRHHPNLSALLYTVSLQEKMVLVDRLKAIGRMPGKNRLMLFVLQAHARQTAFQQLDALTFDFPLSQVLIGDAIGLTTVYVNRTVRELEEEGLMSVRNREVTIFNRRRMIELCDFKDRYRQLDTTWFPGFIK
ncbi:Crp/Fnr family transcriptional regulator [Allohahella marinimesophila]|uniref:Crp/Fnr family transcriptional regulator n=1 Tax=Allohahella marinimesophila TaxID=1054972 RepID=A0ABP7NP79_9GAMM